MFGCSSPVSVPHLQTDRLLLREYRLGDFDAYADHVANPQAMKFFPSVVDRAMARRFFSANMGEWLLQGAGWWAIELRDSGTLAGNVGAFFREGWPEIELGWNTFQAYWRRGIATEAATEVVRYAFEVRGERRVTALIHPLNTASLRVAAHLGMTCESETEVFGHRCGRYVQARF
jgi:RimJ/RimL family protein N-acetyltransferase